MAWRAGILDAPVFYGNVFAWCFSGGVAYLVSRRKAAVGMWFLLPILYIYASVAACLSIMGVFAPFLMTISMTALAVHFQCTEDSFRHRLVAAGLGVGAVLGLFACQYLGLWCAPVRLTGEEIRVDATVLRFDSRWSLLVLGLATFQQFVVFVWRDWQLHVRVTKAEEAFELRHWQLRHLVPSAKVIPVIAQNMPGTSVETAPNLLPTNGEGARGSSPGRQGGS
jgi:hypothetical protein